MQTQKYRPSKRATELRALYVRNIDNNSNANGNNNLNNNARFLRITQAQSPKTMYNKLISYENLFHAYIQARKHKTKKQYVIDFEKNLNKNLENLAFELTNKTYKPKPLETFIIRDPKTRKISKSDFKDRVVHHALFQIIEPSFEKIFIHDSYANRTNKGTIKALERFEHFKRKISKNNTKNCFVLKADIRHYFDTVNHEILNRIIRKQIKDENIISLINVILENHNTPTKGKGMPLGNLTSQFFANVYLNELDQFVKHKIKAKYYIRYVDDFVIFDTNPTLLQKYKTIINEFLKEKLDLELHPEKSKVIHIRRGICFLGLRIYSHHKLLKKSNVRKFKHKIQQISKDYDNKKVDYDSVYDYLEGWMEYSKQANIHKLRKKLLKEYYDKFVGVISSKELNRLLKGQKT